MARVLLAPLVVVVALLASAAPAHAVACDALPTLTDPEGYDWSFSNTAGVSSDDHVGFADSGTVYLDSNYDYQYGADSQDCETEDGGREVRYPAQQVGDLELAAKIYVPSAGTAFVRHLWTFRNAGSTGRTVNVRRDNRVDYSSTRILASSSGDAAATPADDWFTFDNSADPADPVNALVWQGPGPRRTALEALFEDCCTPSPGPVADGFDRPQLDYQSVVVPPGGTVALMQFILARGDADAARTAAEALAGSASDALAGLSDDEIRALHNFVPPDADRDGVANDADNCLNAVNADQANADGDAAGDACDEDDDNDGASDALEAELRTDPRRPDTDGDGRSDREDACPVTASALPTGCPLFDDERTLNAILGRVDPKSTSARLTPRRDRRAPFRFVATGSVVPPDALPAARACASKGFVSMQVKRRGATISTRRARLKADCTYRIAVTFRNRRRIGPGRQSLRFTIRWLGNRFLEPARIATATRRVG